MAWKLGACELGGLESLEYDPAMSSMPGFPIIVFWDKPENYEDEVKLMSSQGELINLSDKGTYKARKV
jgi:hypothetical protein